MTAESNQPSKRWFLVCYSPRAFSSVPQSDPPPSPCRIGDTSNQVTILETGGSAAVSRPRAFPEAEGCPLRRTECHSLVSDHSAAFPAIAPRKSDGPKISSKREPATAHPFATARGGVATLRRRTQRRKGVTHRRRRAAFHIFTPLMDSPPTATF